MDERRAVKQLGELIGYGNMMTLASELWKRRLESKGYPLSGAFEVCLPSELQQVKAERDKLREALTDIKFKSRYKINYIPKDDLYYTPVKPEEQLKAIGKIATNALTDQNRDVDNTESEE
jgi:hypothetical protein